MLSDTGRAADLLFRKLEGIDEHVVKRHPLLCHYYALALFEIGDYPQALRWHELDYASGVDFARSDYALLRLSYIAAMCRDTERTAQFFFLQYDIRDRPWQNVGQRIWSVLGEQIVSDSIYHDTRRIGIFFLSSTEALGHAILDPYHFLALNRDRFDKIYFIGPSRDTYRAASAVCIEILEQFGEYIEVEDDLMLNLSWMNLGEQTIRIDELVPPHDFARVASNVAAGLQLFGKKEFGGLHDVELSLVVKNYWGLLREVYLRHGDRSDEFQHNSWCLTLPNHIDLLGRSICERENIDLAKPLVVLHLREPQYHQLTKQSFRDTKPHDYIPAIRHLLARGFQVVRIGDRSNQRLPIRQPGYFEAPFLKCYSPELDPFLISRAAFMVGCQSGPCAYARAFGVPLLSVNAVLHYTLFPSSLEMACFKRYVRVASPQDRTKDADEISIAQALEQNFFHMENTFQFRRAGIRVVACTSDEIVAAVDDMLNWLAHRNHPPTAEQAEFARLVKAVCERLRTETAVSVPLADYLGIDLPGYRIAPTVATARRDPPIEISAEAQISDGAETTPPGNVAQSAA